MGTNAPSRGRIGVQRGRGRGRSSAADDGPEAVRCLLCKRRFRAIAAMHLWVFHGFEGEHPVLDYKERFGLRVAASRSTCRLMRRAREAKLTREGHFWPRERVLEALRLRVRAGLPMAPSRLSVALRQSVVRRFGTWEKAVRRAGVSDPVAHRLHRRWDRDTLVAEIHGLRRAGERLSDTGVRASHPALYRAAFRIAGSWGAAMRLADLDPHEYAEPTMWSIDSIKAWVRATHRAGESIRTSDAPDAMVKHVHRHTGMTWAYFIESLRIPYPGGTKRSWTDAAVLEDIRRLDGLGLALNVSTVGRNGHALTKQARDRFGSWEAAVRAAGLEPQPLRRNWSRADLVTEVLRRKRSRKSLDRGRALADDTRVVRAAERVFGSWKLALAAAGLA